ncbi:MAG: hypothetical protein MSG64_16755 [Pyrinomonadaceae bacterium MAG19_C2-C3]|nr:hypothetical protein [Pyrinomonadaceae bacterium MAG19_C2-C3]
MNKTGKGGFKKGVSGNSNGRPPKTRALSEALRVKCENSRDALCETLIQIALTGETVTASGEIVTAKLSERIEVIKFLFGQIDGAPPKAKEDEPEENEMTVRVIQEDDENKA